MFYFECQHTAMQRKCEHHRRAAHCRVCSPSSFCVHNRRRVSCTRCAGGSICVHRKRRSQCAICGGNSLCIHHHRKTQCVDCLPLSRLLGMRGYCDCCGMRRIDRRRPNGGVCAACNTRRNQTIAATVWDMLSACIHHTPSSSDSTMVGAKRGGRCAGVDGGALSCGNRRPDHSWVGQDRVVYLEIDEDSHSGRTTACELAKIDETAYTQTGTTGAIKPAIFIRFNPDADDTGSPLRLRVQVLADVILFLCSTKYDIQRQLDDAAAPVVIFLFYHQKSHRKIEAAKSSFAVVCVNTPPPSSTHTADVITRQLAHHYLHTSASAAADHLLQSAVVGS